MGPVVRRKLQRDQSEAPQRHSSRGVSTQPLLHVRSSRGGLEVALGSFATTGALHFSCNRISVYHFFRCQRKIFAWQGHFTPKNDKECKEMTLWWGKYLHLGRSPPVVAEFQKSSSKPLSEDLICKNGLVLTPLP
jgi:hypothetical protein